MYGWTLSTILSFIVRITYSVQNFALSGPLLGFDEFVIVNCTTKGPSVSVAWLETENVPPDEGGKTKIAPKVDPMLSITDTCCSIRTWNVTVKNKESLVAWRWKNSSKEIVTCEGADVELFCNIATISYSHVNWRRKRDFFPGKSLRLSNIQREDHGTYWCEASNAAGGMLKKDITLVIEFPPMITVPNKEINGSYEGECFLQCTVEAYPTPSITWYKEDVALDVQSDPHYDITVHETGNCTTVSILKVIIVHNGTLIKSKLGNYTCQAKNRHGTSAASLRIVAPIDDIVTDGHFIQRKFNVTGFIIGMLPPIFISVYIIIKLGYRSRYAEERGEEEGVQEEPFFVSH